MSLFPEVTTTKPAEPKPESRPSLTTERPNVLAEIAAGKARRAAAKAEAAERRAKLAELPSDEDAPTEAVNKGGRKTTPENLAAWAELERAGRVRCVKSATVEALRKMAAKAGRKVARRAVDGEMEVRFVDGAKSVEPAPKAAPSKPAPKPMSGPGGRHDAVWAAIQRDGSVTIEEDYPAVVSLYKRAKVAGITVRSEKIGPAVWRVERTSAPAAVAKSSTTKAAPEAPPKAPQTSAARVAPKSPTAPMVVSVNPTPSMVLVREGSRIEVFAPSVVTIDAAGAVRVEPAGAR